MYIKIKHEKWCYWGGLYITWMGFLGKSDENGWKPDWKSINSKRSYNSCVLFSKDDLNTASEVSRCFFLQLKKYIVREIRVLSNPQTSAVKRHWILSRPCSLPSISLHDNRRESPRRPAKGISLWFVFFYQCNLSPHCQHISPLCVQKHRKVNLSAGDAAARTAKPQFECLLACLSEGVRHEWPRLSLRRGD